VWIGFIWLRVETSSASERGDKLWVSVRGGELLIDTLDMVILCEVSEINKWKSRKMARIDTWEIK